MVRARTLDYAGVLLAVLAAGLAVSLGYVFGTVLGTAGLVLLFAIPVLLTIWLGDVSASATSVVLSVLALSYFLTQAHEGFWVAETAAPVVLFLLQGIFLSWMVGALRSRVERSAEVANAFLESLKRQQAAKKDQDSDEVLTRLVQNLPDVIFRLDMSLRFVYVSPVLAKHFDIAATELDGRLLSEVNLPAELRDTVQSETRVALEAGQTRAADFGLAGPRGRRAYKARFIPEINERGWAVSVLCILTDVTRTKQFEEELHRFRAMSSTSNDLCFCADAADGRLTFVNPRVLEQLGYGEEEILKLTLLELHDGIDAEQMQTWARELAAQRKMPAFEALFRHKSGKKLPVELTLSLLEVDGRPNLCGVARDLSERKLAEEALRIFRERLDMVVQSIGLGLWYCDLPFDRLIWNETCKEHFGLPAEAEVTIDTFFERLHPDDRERTRLAIDQAINAGATYDIDYRTFDRDGRERWLRAIGRCFFNGQGKPVRFDGVTLDTTERKRTEEALKEADRRKNQFLAILSHELRNPLAAIRNAMHLFNGVRLTDPILQEGRAIIDRQTQLLGGIVDDLLDVFRITHDKIVLREETLDITEVARQVVGDLQSSMNALGLTVEIDVPNEPVWVRGDRLRLSQVIINLLNNAGKFTPPGGKIFVTVGRDALLRNVCVSVRDTGKGIDPAMLPHIFDTFSQGDQDLARSTGGLGLGLALVKGLVELQKGRVWVRSPGVGHGAEFVFEFPEAPGPAAPPALPEPPPAGERSLRLLIIEDNQDTARTLALLLRRFGHQVEMAHGGLEGVQKARATRPNVVLCDLGLPEIDGYEVARTLRADPVTTKARLIAVSGYGQEEERQRSEEAGFDLHLTKPVDPADLQRLLSVLQIDA